jgi:uncharacterized iron-regulated membrane protein
MANPRVWNRRLHRWGAAAVALPFLIVLVTGLLLQVKKQVAWVQPPERRGSDTAPLISFDELLAAARTVPQAGISNWDDIDRLDVRPGKGMIKVRAKSNWEIQLDGATGAVLQTAYRRSDVIASMHDGSWFHEHLKLWVFLPSAFIVLALWVTGVYLYLLPYLARRTARVRREHAGSST